MTHVPKGSKCEYDSKDSTEIRAGIQFFKIPDPSFKWIPRRDVKNNGKSRCAY